MENIKELIQEKFNSIESVSCGLAIPDGLVPLNTNYFGYELQETYVDSDLNKNYLMEVSLTGRLVRRYNEEEDTMKELYNALEDIKSALKELNFTYSYNDITLDDNYRKVLVKANCRYYEANNELV